MPKAMLIKLRFESLREKSCRILLHFLRKKDSGYASEASEQLTPFVQAIYASKLCLPRLRVEPLKDFFWGLKKLNLRVECEASVGGSWVREN